jgi:hypothetical protein
MRGTDNIRRKSSESEASLGERRPTIVRSSSQKSLFEETTEIKEARSASESKTSVRFAEDNGILLRQITKLYWR